MEAISYCDEKGRLVLGIAIEDEQESQLGLNSQRELDWALENYDPSDPSSVRWLAVCAANRALDLEPRPMSGS